MADYKATNNGVFRYEGELHIPSDEGNRHWQEYLEYVEQGGLTDPSEEEEA